MHHDTNRRKGQALRTALQYIHSLQKDAVIVTADTDGQLAVTDIDRIAHATKRLSNRLICRYSSIYQRPLSSHFGNKLKRLLFHLQRGVKVSNTQTGLLVFHTNLIPFILTIEGNQCEYKMNMLTLPSKRYNITEVSIETIYIDDNASSHFRTVRDGMMMYNNLFKFALTSIFLTSAHACDRPCTSRLELTRPSKKPNATS